MTSTAAYFVETDGAFEPTALANPAAQIDFTATPRNQAPGAELFSGSAS